MSYDEGGNTPLGKEQFEVLIKTPLEMANFQSPSKYNQDLILTNALRCTSFLMGDDNLYKQYIQAMNAILNGVNPKDNLSIKKKRALDLIKGHLPEFKPELSIRKQENPVFEVKAELTRLIVFLIQGIGEYLGIEETNTWEKLDRLADQGFTTAYIKKALTYAVELRLRCHKYYREECDFVYHASMQSRPEAIKLKNPYFLSGNQVIQIIEIYRVLFPMHRAFQQFIQTQNLDMLKKQTFYDTTLFQQWEAIERRPYDVFQNQIPNNVEWGRLTNAKVDPTVRERVLKSIAYACSTSEENVEKHLKDWDLCHCYKNTVIQHGFYQDCVLTEDFIEKSLVPFMLKLKLYELTLIGCQAQDGALKPLMRNWRTLNLRLLLIPRILTSSELNECVRQEPESADKQDTIKRRNKLIEDLKNKLMILQNPFSIDEEYRNSAKNLLENREVGPFAFYNGSIIALKIRYLSLNSLNTNNVNFDVIKFRFDDPDLVPGMSSRVIIQEETSEEEILEAR